MDYVGVIESLRRKAKDKAVGEEEAKALNAKADELEKKYRKANPKDITKLAEFMDEFMATFPKLADFPEEWYELMDNWDQSDDWYSGAE